jgi:glycosyltransferase involved in cell wall biosynthesis
MGRADGGAEQPAVPSPELVDVSIVVPYFNPGPVLRHHVEAVVGALEASGLSFEVITVSDGSTDGSAEALQDLPDDRVVQVRRRARSGKGAALRQGLALGRGRWLGFIDGDGDIPADELLSLVEVMEATGGDIVLGSKRHPGSVVAYPPMRRLYSWGFQQLTRALFHLDVRDTQTGVKLVRREVLEAVLPLLAEEGFAFDLELFVVARHLGFDRFCEAPVVIRERFRSTVDLGAVASMALATLRVLWRLRVSRGYGPGPGPGGRRLPGLRPSGR